MSAGVALKLLHVALFSQVGGRNLATDALTAPSEGLYVREGGVGARVRSNSGTSKVDQGSLTAKRLLFNF